MNLTDHFTIRDGFLRASSPLRQYTAEQLGLNPIYWAWLQGGKGPSPSPLRLAAPGPQVAFHCDEVAITTHSYTGYDCTNYFGNHRAVYKVCSQCRFDYLNTADESAQRIIRNGALVKLCRNYVDSVRSAPELVLPRYHCSTRSGQWLYRGYQSRNLDEIVERKNTHFLTIGHGNCLCGRPVDKRDSVRYCLGCTAYIVAPAELIGQPQALEAFYREATSSPLEDFLP